MSPAPLNGHNPAAPPVDGLALGLGLDVVGSAFGPAIRYTIQSPIISGSWIVPVDRAEQFCVDLSKMTAETVRQYRRKASGLVLPSET